MRCLHHHFIGLVQYLCISSSHHWYGTWHTFVVIYKKIYCYRHLIGINQTSVSVRCCVVIEFPKLRRTSSEFSDGQDSSQSKPIGIVCVCARLWSGNGKLYYSLHHSNNFAFLIRLCRVCNMFFFILFCSVLVWFC